MSVVVNTIIGQRVIERLQREINNCYIGRLIPDIGSSMMKGALLGAFAGLILARRNKTRMSLIVYGASFGLGMSLDKMYKYYFHVKNIDASKLEFIDLFLV